MTTLKDQLTEIYRPELDSLAAGLGVQGAIVNTGGGCMAVSAVVGQVPGTNHPMELLVTTADAGLADERAEIVHWYACLYDVEEGGEALADGHDVTSFDAACDRALQNLREGVPASDGLCACLGAAEQDS
jgi:hypothetical protein